MATPVRAKPTHVCATLSPLRIAREKKGLSLRETAARAHIDHAHLWRVERGEAQLSVDALYRLAAVLNLRRLRNTLEPFIAEQDAK